MPVALVDDGLAVGLGREGAGLQLTGIKSEPHRAALVGDVALLRQEIDHRMAGEGVELGAVGVGLAQQIAPELDHGALHSETEPEIGGERGPGESGRGNLPLNAAMTEYDRDHEAVDLVE